MIDWDANVLAPLEAVFGEPVLYLPAAGASFQVSGVFDEAYRELDLAGGIASTTDMPVLGVRLSQFPVAPKQGDSLTVLRTSATYAVKEVRPDSHGAARLMLNYLSP
jgi:predicted permease